MVPWDKGHSPYPGISLNPGDLVTKTIIEVVKIRAEFGRTYNDYIGFICEDGTRVLIHGDAPYSPDPSLEEMRKSDFFTTEELLQKSKRDIVREQEHKEDARKRDLKELEQLKKRLGVR